MATLKDVAQLAGVSPSTISYVLNGKKTVRPETLKRIDDAIDQLGYYPNLAASSLKTNHSKTIGVVVSDLTNLFNVDVITSIEEELSKYEYCMIVCNSNNDAKQEKRCIRKLLSRNIDGILLIGTGINDFSHLKNQNIPLVCVDRFSGNEFYTLRTDSFRCGQIAAEYLNEKGYRKVLFIGNERYQFARERHEGFLSYVNNNDSEMDIRYVGLDEFRADEAFEKVTELIEQGLDFDAVYGCVDYYAIGAMSALIEKGIRIPEDVGILGNDDIAPAKFVTPALTSIAQRKEDLGRKSVQCLMDILDQNYPKEKLILIDPVLIERESCKR